MSFAAHYTYWVTIFLMIAGLYIVIARGNLVKKLIGLAFFRRRCICCISRQAS